VDYWSILASGLLGAIGGMLGYWVFSKFWSKRYASIGTIIGAILFYQLLKPLVYDKYIQPITQKSQINQFLTVIQV
jgi:tetrahydromethanopterin S-methyltransferase subunit D